MLKKLTKITAVSALTLTGCISTVGTVLANEPNTTLEANVKAETNKNLVSLQKDGSKYTFGNDLISRTFNTAEKLLKTEYVTNYRTESKTVLVPQENSEEFIIQTMPKTIEGKTKITVNDTVGTGEGNIGYLIDGVVSNDDSKNYWASKPADQQSENPELAIEIDFSEAKNVSQFKYVPRYASGQADNGYQCVGRVEKAQIYYLDNSGKWKLVKGTNSTKQDGVVLHKDQPTTLSFDEVNTTKIKFVAKETYHWQQGQAKAGNHPDYRNKVMSASEIDVMDKNNKSVVDRPSKKAADTIKSSNLTLNDKVENPKLTKENGVSTLTFTFNEKEFGGIKYTIKEVITMKDGDSFMRKHLEILVPEEDAEQAQIAYIDLENMNFLEKDTNGKIGEMTNNFWTIPELKDNPDMANMKGDYLELGQPYYVGAMYWGSEFPETENKIRENSETKKKNGFIRYHYGKSLAIENQFNAYRNYNKANGKPGKMITWDAVVGAARSTDYQVVQADFYEYIETIATPTDFRQQFNSWYDNMKDITAENIKSSFYDVEKGFTQYGVNPLDSYVVDDGWINYSSFWDFNHKFPNELYDSSLQVKQLGSNFGLWVGPRGGYGTQTQIANWLANNNLGSVNVQSGSDINISDARYLNVLVEDIFKGYQEKFDINYWKLDGMLLEPSTAEGNHHVVGSPFYTISETYERWTDMYEAMREQRGDKGLWINMTSYTNPSPWHLQWVNSVWMQNTGDSGFDYKFGASDQEAMLTYRDGDYYDFFNENQWQLPNKYFYNHDPVYAKTAHSAPGGKHPIHYSTKELREHLYMLGTRGTAFWEYYYSPSMFDDEKWAVNAESANWIKDNFHILQKSKMFGGNPETGDVYGYSSWNGNEGIVSIRNPHEKKQSYKLKYDRLVGVSEDVNNVYGKVVIGNIEKYQNNKPLKYGDEIEFELEPKEVLIIQYGEKDNTSATISSVKGNNNKVEVEFNETIRELKASMFTVEGNTVKSAKLNANLRTVELTLDSKLKDATNMNVSVNGVQDVVGNVTKANVKDDYYENAVINSIVDRKLDGKAVNKGSAYAIDGKGGFSVTGTIKTESTDAEIMRQGDEYVVGIDKDGYLTFTFKGLTVSSKHVQKTVNRNSATRANHPVTVKEMGKINDGKQHQFSAVKEVNGMIKLYMDGVLVASAYDENNINPEVKKADLVFGDGLKGSVEYVSVLDKAVAYDEVAKFVNVEGNVMSRSMNPKVEISAYDVTADKAVPEKGDKPFANLNDGSKNKDNYLELKDTKDYSKDGNHSRYVEIDLGETYELNKLHLTRYFQDSRTYGPTVIVLSEDKEFTNKMYAYNSDTTGKVHGLEKGKDSLYQETPQGKEIQLKNPTSARYIRIYVNGRTENKGTSDHLVEFETYGTRKAKSIYRVDYSRLDAAVNMKLDGIYTTSSIKRYKNAVATTLKDAKVLLANKDAKSDQVVDDLYNALIIKQNEILVKRGNIDDLKKLVDANSNRKQADYDVSEEQWNAFMKAFNHAKAIVADNSDQSQEDVDAAKVALETAVKVLEDHKKLNKPVTGDTTNIALLWITVLGAGAIFLATRKKLLK